MLSAMAIAMLSGADRRRRGRGSARADPRAAGQPPAPSGSGGLGAATRRGRARRRSLLARRCSLPQLVAVLVRRGLVRARGHGSDAWRAGCWRVFHGAVALRGRRRGPVARRGTIGVATVVLVVGYLASVVLPLADALAPVRRRVAVVLGDRGAAGHRRRQPGRRRRCSCCVAAVLVAAGTCLDRPARHPQRLNRPWRRRPRRHSVGGAGVVRLSTSDWVGLAARRAASSASVSASVVLGRPARSRPQPAGRRGAAPVRRDERAPRAVAVEHRDLELVGRAGSRARPSPAAAEQVDGERERVVERHALAVALAQRRW